MTKFWFVGSGSFAAECLSRLSRGIRFGLVVTGTPSVAGRGLKSRPTEVDVWCHDAGIDIHRTECLRNDAILKNLLEEDTPDLLLVVDFGQKVLPPFLNLPRFGCYNIHPSLLPRYRGAAPVQRSILAGDSESGVTLFRLVESMDAGPIVAQETIPIPGDTCAGEFASICANKGSELFLNGVKSIIDGTCEFREQNSESVSYAVKIHKDESRVVWSEPSDTIHNRVRAFNPEPGAFFSLQGKRVKVWRTRKSEGTGSPGTLLDIDREGFPVVAAGRGGVTLISVQPEGKRTMTASDWIRGIRLNKGAVLE